MSKDTKQRLLEQGLSSFMTKGFNHTGIQEVLQAVDVPKGSFYHYFKSKEDFGKQVLQLYSSQMMAWTLTIFADTSRTPVARFRNFFEQALARMDEKGYSGGCLLGNMCQEMGDLSQDFEQMLEDKMTGMAKIFVCNIREAQSLGELSADIDAEALGDFLVNSWQGALLRMKVAKSSAPLDIFIKVVMDHIFA